MALADNDKIIEMLQSEDQKEMAFRLLMKEYGERLYWHIRRIVVSHDDAEDVMQETVMNVYRHIGKFKGESALSTWIYRIATNESIRWLHKKVGWLQSIDSNNMQLAELITTENPVEADAIETLFQKALLTLPTQQRIAFNMRYYDELSYEEISNITGKNVNTLKTNYHLAAEKVKKYINENAI